jgi:ATP-binding cassette subfamily E protein 1
VKEAQEAEIDAKAHMNYKYPAMTKTQGDFKLAIEAGEFTDSQIVVMLGQNGACFGCFHPALILTSLSHFCSSAAGTGKTTFIRMLAGLSVRLLGAWLCCEH